MFDKQQQLGARTDEWSNSWWDHCFNKASANLNIDAAVDAGVVLKKETNEKTLLYGAFVKSGYSFLKLLFNNDYFTGIRMIQSKTRTRKTTLSKYQMSNYLMHAKAEQRERGQEANSLAN